MVMCGPNARWVKSFPYRHSKAGAIDKTRPRPLTLAAACWPAACSVSFASAAKDIALTSVLIVDSDPIALELLQRAFGARDSRTCIAHDAGRALALIEQECRDCVGLITSIDLGGPHDGWDLARVARTLNPDIAVGYMSAERHRDWVAYGVPDSVLVNKTIDAGEIARAFLAFCDMPDRAAMHIGSRPPPLGDLYAMLMQAPSFIACLEGVEHRYTFANAAYLHLVERDVIGRRVADALPEVVAQGFVEILDRIYASGEPFIGKGMTIEFERTDGSVKKAMIDLKYHPMRDAAGDIIGIFVTGEDATEHHRAQTRIAALQHELIHVSRVNAMGMLASSIAHELNQPLTMIHNHMVVAETLVARRKHDPRATHSLQAAADAALRAGDIIRNLKAMSVRREPVRAPVPLDETLREAAALAGLGRADVRMDLDLRGAATVLGDRVQIQQVMMNLLQNALDAAADDAVGIVIATADRGAFVEISVTDDGPGIEPALLPRMFDPFVTARAEGTGIGLSICKAIVEAHGGRIQAENRAGGGARFSFTLPRDVDL
jgi:signal transduction histidine kinase/CheY-like chemotaxis protein